MELLSHPLYMAPVALYTKLYNATGLVIDGDAPFVKQTFRNRCTIAAENGPLSLNIPVVHDGGRTAMRNVRISEHGNCPFFEYYADDFAHFYEERDGFLMDFNLRLHSTVCGLLGLEKETRIATAGETEELTATALDLRSMAEPKGLAACAVGTQPYYQVFAQRHGFLPNLSIADLLFNMGPEGLITLKESTKETL